MAKCNWRLIPALIVILFLALSVFLIDLGFKPAQGDKALIIKKPLGLIAGYFYTGEPGVVMFSNGSALIVGGGGDPTLIEGLKPYAACSFGKGKIIVSGTYGLEQAVALYNISGRNVTAFYTFSGAARPLKCVSENNATLVLFTDPIARNRVVVLRGDSAILVNLPNKIPAALNVAAGSDGTVIVTGKGYYLEYKLLNGSLKYSLYSIEYDNSPINIVGAFFYKGKLVLYGNAKYTEGDIVRTAAFLRLPSGEWRVYYREGIDTKIHAAYSPYPGTIRIVVEVVGKETDIVDIDAETGEQKYVGRFTVMAAYSLNKIRVADDAIWIEGDIFAKIDDQDIHWRIVHMIKSNTPYVVGKGPQLALSGIFHGKKLKSDSVQVAVTIGQTGMKADVRLLQPSEDKPPVREAHADYEYYGVYVDRDVLALALAAVLSVLYFPVALAVDRYNGCEPDTRE